MKKYQRQLGVVSVVSLASALWVIFSPGRGAAGVARLFWVAQHREAHRPSRDRGRSRAGTLSAAVSIALLAALLFVTCGADIGLAGEPQHEEECSVQAAAGAGTPTAAALLSAAIPSRAARIAAAPARWSPGETHHVGEPRVPVVSLRHLRSPPPAAIA